MRISIRQAAVVAVACMMTTLVAPVAAAQDGRRLDVGVSAGSNGLQRANDIENSTGERVDVVRVFKKLTDNFPNQQEQRLLAAGYDLIVSIDSSTAGGTVGWRAMADARPGSQLHDEMSRWAESLRPWGDRVHITFQHEPESRINVNRGGAGDFIAAWRAFMGILDDAGVQTKGRIWTMTSYSFRVDAADRRAAARWYPGDAWVDGFAAAAYNWGGCRPGFNDPWRPLSEALEPFRQFGANHPDAELMISELGSTEDPNQPGRKAAWMRDAAETLTSPGYEQFSTVVWFDGRHDQRDGANSCDWRLASSGSVMPAFGDMVRELHGDRDPAPAPAPATTTTTEAPVTTTTAVRPTTTTTAAPGPTTTTTARIPTTASPRTAAPETTPPTTASPTTGAPVVTAPPVDRSSGTWIGGGRLDGAGDWMRFELAADTDGRHRLDVSGATSADLGFNIRSLNGHFVGAAGPGERSIVVELVAGEVREVTVWSRSGSGDIEVRLSAPSNDERSIRSSRVDASGAQAAATDTMRWTADQSGPARFVLDWSQDADLILRVVGPDGGVLGVDDDGADLALVEVDLVAGATYDITVAAGRGNSSYQLLVGSN